MFSSTLGKNEANLDPPAKRVYGNFCHLVAEKLAERASIYFILACIVRAALLDG
jgi:hypothetical protein